MVAQADKQPEVAGSQLLMRWAGGSDLKWRADPARTGKIVGGVVGGVAGLLIILGLIFVALYARATYQKRSKRRLIQDEVYNLVVGIRHHAAVDDLMATDMDLKPQVLQLRVMHDRQLAGILCKAA